MSSAVNYLSLSPADFVYLFFTGMLAIGAMVLPGISGSSLLMIFGVYVPTLRALTHLFELEPGVLPGLAILMLGFLIGAGIFARFIRRAMHTFRPQMIFLILGLMLGSLYAICLEPTTMESPMLPLTLPTFRMSGFFARHRRLAGSGVPAPPERKTPARGKNADARCGRKAGA